MTFLQRFVAHFGYDPDAATNHGSLSEKISLAHTHYYGCRLSFRLIYGKELGRAVEELLLLLLLPIGFQIGKLQKDNFIRSRVRLPWDIQGYQLRAFSTDLSLKLFGDCSAYIHFLQGQKL